MNWLVKEEPTHYGFDALVKDRKAVWSGVRNALAHRPIFNRPRRDSVGAAGRLGVIIVITRQWSG